MSGNNANVSYYGATAILGSFFGTFTPPSTVYLGLCVLGVPDPTTDSLTVASSGLEVPTGVGYARLAIATGPSQWTSPADGVLANLNDLYFDEATGSWGAVVAYFLSDVASGAGDLYLSSPFASPWSVTTGVAPKIAAGTLAFTLGSDQDATIL